MTEGLTERDYHILGAAFEPSEIGSNGGKAYVKARAIKKRLRMIDPNYTTDIDTYIQVIGDVVTVWGGLTLKGVRHAGSKSKNVNCWRKTDNGYVRVDDYEYARELANAIMKAKTGLLQRCAETFDVGDYLKDKSSPPPPTLATVLAAKPTAPNIPPPPPEQSPAPKPAESPAPTKLGPQPQTPVEFKKQSWTTNGGVPIFEKKMNDLNLVFADIATTLEPGRTLRAVVDISLPLEDTLKLLPIIAGEKEAKPSGESL